MASQLVSPKAQVCPLAVPAHGPLVLCQRPQRPCISSPRTAVVSSRSLTISAQRDDDVRERLSGVVKTGDNLAEGATNALTGGAPRPLVKGALVLVGGLFAWSLVKKALSLALFFGAIGGGLFLVFKLKFQGGDSKGADGADPDSPLQQARDIWSKYK